MAEKKYVCLRCQEKFTVDVITSEEAREKRLNLSPVLCRNPNCRSADVQPLEKIES